MTAGSYVLSQTDYNESTGTDAQEVYEHWMRHTHPLLIDREREARARPVVDGARASLHHVRSQAPGQA